MKTFTIYFSEKNVWKIDIQANTAKEAEQKMFDFLSIDQNKYSYENFELVKTDNAVLDAIINKEVA